MVHAINQHGIEREFSDRVWALMPKGKNGWIEYDAQALGGALIPQQVVEFQQSLKKDAVVEENFETKELVVEFEVPIEPQKGEKQDIEHKPYDVTTMGVPIELKELIEKIVEPDMAEQPPVVEKKTVRVKKANVVKTKKHAKR